MTPKEYANEFLELDVFIFSSENPATFDEGSWVRTKVSSYRLGASYDPAKNPLPPPGPDGKVGPRQIVHPYQDDLTSAVKIKVKVKRIDGVDETGTSTCGTGHLSRSSLLGVIDCLSIGDLAPTESGGDHSQNCLHDVSIVGNA
jgi:hypothetical protein